MFDVSIVVPFHSEETLATSLNSLCQFKNDASIEFILVSNGASSGTYEVAQSFCNDHPEISTQLLATDKETGIVACFNMGIDISSAPNILLVKPRFSPKTDGWLDKLVEVLNSDETIIATGPKLLYKNNLTYNCGFLMSRGLPVVADEGKPENEPRVSSQHDMLALSAEFLLLKESLLEEIPFDNAFTAAYFDVDFGIRAKKANKRIVFEPSVAVINLAPEAMQVLAKDIEHFVDKYGGLEELDLFNNAGEYYGSGRSLPSTEVWLQKIPEGSDKTSKGKIVCFLADHQGCGHYRMKSPYRELILRGWDVMFTTYSPPEFIQWGDILVFQRQCAEHMWEKVQIARKKGKKVIYEIDDFFHGLSMDNPVTGSFAENPQWLRNMEKIIYQSHALTVSTPELAKQYGRFNSNTHIVPNYVDLAAIPNPIIENTDGTIRIGWGGSATHNADIKLIGEAVQKIMDEYPQTRLVFLGTDYRPFFPNLPVDRVEWYPSTFDHEDPVGDYYKVLNEARIDIGIAPITDSVFNRAKSDIKLVEFGAFGIACIASDVDPYSDLLKKTRMGFLAKTTRDWYKHLKNLVESPELRLEVGRNLQIHVWQNRGVDKMGEKIEQICLDLLAGKEHTPNKIEPIHSLSVNFLNHMTSKQASAHWEAMQEQVKAKARARGLVLAQEQQAA